MTAIPLSKVNSSKKNIYIYIYISKLNFLFYIKTARSCIQNMPTAAAAAKLVR